MRESIREMSEQELEQAMIWAEKEGWNPGKYDYKSYYAQDPKGFLLLLVDGEPIGSISLVKYSDRFAFIGLFIVLPEHRGKGYGEKLWQAAMKCLEAHSSVGLYAVPAQVSRYKKSSFSTHGGNRRWKMPESKPGVQPAGTTKDPKAVTSKSTEFTKLVEYDTLLWKESRKNFLSTLLAQPQSFAFIMLDKGTVKAYGVIRPCVKGFRVGPLYSNDKESAKDLTYALISQIPEGSEVIFDIPQKNEFSEIFAEYFNLARVKSIDTEAMFKGEIHNGSEEKCYGVSSLEIG